MPAKLMIDNRIVINNHLKRARGGKVSFTHLIAWAMVQVIKEFPSQNVYYDEVDGKPSVVTPAHINLGIAIDLPKDDGTRTLVVPGIKRADTMSFAEFLTAYEDVVSRARAGKLTMADYEGNTISLTNPGGIGTEHSIPRLMRGAGCIVGAGALEYPAEFQGASPKTLAELGIGKTITLTSTYDHRVIQGAGLRRVPQAHPRAAHRRAPLLRGHLRRAAHPVRPDPLGRRHQRRHRGQHRQDRASAGAHQLVPGARPPHGRHRPARVQAALASRPRHLQPRPDLLGPRPRVRHRRLRRQAHRAAARDPRHPARLVLPHDRHRVHAHPGPGPAALDPGPRREAVHQARARRADADARPAQRGRGVRDVPADQVRRPEAVQPRGRRVDDRDARPDHPGRCGDRARGGRDRHGPPRPPQRAHQHRRQDLRPDLPRVRGHPGPAHGAGLRRCEVPPRHRGHLHRREREDHPGVSRSEPLAPRSRRRCARGHRPGQAGPPADRLVHRAADPGARRCRVQRPGRGRRGAADVAAARLPHRRHHPRRRQQPGRVHDAAGRGAHVDLLAPTSPRPSRRRSST